VTGAVRVVAVVAGLVVMPGIAFIAAKSRPHAAAPPPIHLSHPKTQQQSEPSLPV
jgi:hypothetical protein